MGQYHKLVNLDKKEYVHGHRIDNGLKLMEQCGFEKCTATALWLLLACSNGRGGGDAKAHPMVGRWAGDRIIVVGDYAEEDDVPGLNAKNIYHGCELPSPDHPPEVEHYFTDISLEVKEMLDLEFDE